MNGVLTRIDDPIHLRVPRLHVRSQISVALSRVERPE
jgi:hypothetical protein